MKRLTILSLFLLFSLISFSQATAEWRGKDRKGIYPEANLLQKWPDSGLNLIWVKKDLGNGYGTPAVTSDRLYLTGGIDSVEYVFCLDKKGNDIWKKAIGKGWVISYPGSRSTPTVAGDLLYVTTGWGNLYCLNTKDGTEKWHIDKEALHGTHSMHGHSESPLLNGDLVYLIPGGKDTNVVALNRFDGKIKWISKGEGYSPAYNSPVLINLPARKLMVTFTAYALFGFDAETGDLLFRQEQDNVPLDKRGPGYGDTHSNSIWYEDGYIYYFAGDGNGAVKLKLSADGTKIEQVWRNQSIDNYMGGFIKQGNRLYTCLFEKKKLVSLDDATGNIVDSLNVGRGNLISDGKFLYYYNLKGELNLVKPGEKMELISKFRITEGTKEHFSHPVINDGVIYVRRGKALMAYSLKN